MKKSSILLVSVIVFMMISDSVYTQSKEITSEEGFWVLVSNIHRKKNTTV